MLLICLRAPGTYIGGCNDGPGLLPLSRENKLDNLLVSAGVIVKYTVSQQERQLE